MTTAQEKEKLPMREQDIRNKLTLRISPELDAVTKSKAEYIGVSQNAFLVMLIDLGLRYYEANPFPVDE